MSKREIRERIINLITIVNVLSVGGTAIEKAIFSEFKDFEDGIQNYCAEEGGLKTIITRNVKDFKTSKLSIQTPMEFIAKFES